MAGFLELIGFRGFWPYWLPDPTTWIVLPEGALILVFALAAIGTVLLNSILGIRSFFNAVVNFSALLIGGLGANYLYTAGIPSVSDLASTALVANIGMAGAGFALLFAYRNAA